MTDYLNPERIYPYSRSVHVGLELDDNGNVIKVNPAVKDFLTTAEDCSGDEVVYSTPICSGKCCYPAPVRENLTTEVLCTYCGKRMTVPAVDYRPGCYAYVCHDCANPGVCQLKTAESAKMSRERAARVILAKLAEPPKDTSCKPFAETLFEQALHVAIRALRDGEPGYPAANGQQVKNGTGIEEIERGGLDLQVGTAKPGTETVPNCGMETRQSAECAWCGPERIGWFSVQFWVRSCYGNRKWMSVTQQYKHQVRYCPMCGKKVEGSK